MINLQIRNNKSKEMYGPQQREFIFWYIYFDWPFRFSAFSFKRVLRCLKYSVVFNTNRTNKEGREYIFIIERNKIAFPSDTSGKTMEAVDEPQKLAAFLGCD